MFFDVKWCSICLKVAPIPSQFKLMLFFTAVKFALLVSARPGRDGRGRADPDGRRVRGRGWASDHPPGEHAVRRHQRPGRRGRLQQLPGPGQQRPLEQQTPRCSGQQAWEHGAPAVAVRQKKKNVSSLRADWTFDPLKSPSGPFPLMRVLLHLITLYWIRRPPSPTPTANSQLSCPAKNMSVWIFSSSLNHCNILDNTDKPAALHSNIHISKTLGGKKLRTHQMQHVKILKKKKSKASGCF